jgi:50S ribosomal subunit-associated GTPase HflX
MNAFHLHVTHGIDDTLHHLVERLLQPHCHRLECIEAKLETIQQTLEEIKMTDQEVKAVLDKVDATTTKIGSNLDAVAAAQASEASVVQDISDEIDALVAKGANSGVSPETASLLTSIADRLQASSDNSDKITAAIQAQVPVLSAIAAKGAPVVPTPPPSPNV